MSDNDITSRLQRLMQKGFLEITRDVDAGGKLYEKYSVYPLWERILQMIDMKERQQTAVTLQQEEGRYSVFLKRKWGVFLSPLELEKLDAGLMRTSIVPHSSKRR